jgi:thymidylate synthase
MGRCFETMNEGLKCVLDDVLSTGASVAPRGKETRELLNYQFTLTNPRARLITLPQRRWKESLAVGELCWHWAGSNSLDFISYYAKVWSRFSSDGRNILGSCYGRRIFVPSRQSGKSQWESVKSLLQSDPHSRRAVLLIGQDVGEVDLAGVDLPCITSIHFLIRNGRLDCITHMRSNDVFWGMCYDVYLVTMLQERLARELGVSIGEYHHSAASMHIYSEFYDAAREVIADEPQALPVMAPMVDVESIPQFLEVEKRLRTNAHGACVEAERLPLYWRTLAKPLLALQAAKGKDSDLTRSANC